MQLMTKRIYRIVWEIKVRACKCPTHGVIILLTRYGRGPFLLLLIQNRG